MRSFTVVVVGPWLKMSVSFVRFGPVFCSCPLAQRGLDEALGLAVGFGRVGPRAVVLDLHGLADLAKLAGTVAGAVVGEQSAHADAVAGEWTTS